ncbi:DUF6470 family protein [Aneurinibacillus uraniidurans]|uniref:DUF6470 family protein n=1 Tax=Aneurinibacillus uraniidurans TaxID=2966586 RepID=UPI00234B1AFA|nr:DUF6470 family protein [Aneurinibacillus sp. B1]WCN38134.1 DUF6470 family protein [Aneurinibacillus sp. B1]
MNLPQIQIDQTFYKLGWDVQRPSYSFEPGKTELSIEQKPAEMILHRTPPSVQIDQSECWADMDLKHIFRRTREFAQDGKDQWLKYIEKVTRDGEAMGAIENSGNVIRSLAKEKKLLPVHDFTFRNIPGNLSLHMQGIPGELGMDWQVNGTTIAVNQTPFRHYYDKGSISYYTQQKNQLHFQVRGGTIDTVK